MVYQDRRVDAKALSPVNLGLTSASWSNSDLIIIFQQSQTPEQTQKVKFSEMGLGAPASNFRSSLAAGSADATLSSSPDFTTTPGQRASISPSPRNDVHLSRVVATLFVFYVHPLAMRT